MLVKRYLFLDIGGFDPSYVIYFEDVDLAWRAWLYGYKVVYVPMSVVYHKYGGYFGGFNKSSRSVYLGQINRLSNLWKNAEPFTVFKGSLLSLLYDLVKSAYFLRYLRFSRWLALHKGNIAFLMKLPRVLQQRKTVQQRRKYSDKWLMQNNIIASLNESIAVFFRLLKI
ncbi:hypothetical protein HYW21_08035 [Candidatus Woesearchaeota archaeon]|nr:hypothetical protein [Candidatus Woesearchaeota archaeon]